VNTAKDVMRSMSDDDKRIWARYFVQCCLDDYEAKDAMVDAIDQLPLSYIEHQFAYMYDDGGRELRKARKLESPTRYATS